MTAQLASHLTRAPTLAQQQPYLARRQNWVNQLERHAMMQPDAPALRFVGNTMTWADLRRRVAALAGALSGRGVGFGDRVMILMLNRTEFVESVLAANMIGAIAVPLNFRLTPTEIAVLVEDCAAHVMLTEAALAPVAIGVRDIQPLLSVIVVAGGSSEDSVFGYEDLLNEAGDVVEPVDIPNDSPALIMYTSGTTGRPKGAVLTHANLTGQAMTALYTSGANINSDVGFVGVPLFHIAGIGNMLTGLLLGLPTVIYPLGAFDPGQLLDVLEAEKVTGIFLVPAQWQAVCTEQQARPRDLRLRVLSWGAAPAPDALLRQMSATFPETQILAAFGQTEMSPVTCMLLGEDAIAKRGSVGRVIPTVAARVVDQNMNDVPVGEVGEIVYRAPTLMSCYWNNPEATAEAFAGGWFHSGDLVRMDSDGYVWVVDRKKDMIISGGENIYCAELENVLASHPDIAEVAVIGRADEKWGEVPIAVAAVTNDDLRIEDLGEFLTDRLARYKHPKALEIVDALPRNPAGKVLKTELRLRYGACVNVERRSVSADFTDRRENRQRL
ncbi:Putative fatty-acid-coa ligase FadD5 (fatty-acid-CoA synthetase) (fatty-acid-CoA synthase) [Mycobacterium canettii CIPT 140060008]|uniref:Fatty-acid--CoA ligase FadD5 n=2 Tax=Mycobacterium canetti TaxID=78331 RepID=A0ABV1M9X8_9MYCO|nr:fatty-acid--CoA ligase FadD5 [Mycobacterium canetti]MBA2784833.1 fatty-acid--CoA ligase FadD5 [Mycobacterium canetti]MBC9074117.1 fatty-acid--CoA ligase FadD5 [Mycobacterium canetti]CCC42513.1 putative fatty-acid-CoA ligase FADD5 (fatty-acid-CoA synthetase) (fatty-acid-CoA synthase) [Mycobacterium canettii CIPT 140010059]CCK50084.1 Putative fatty-acid-coa ligase FadD5 (fatty-acid-CoA synthetase) (fatty-acid-CoA synthase) [Mycobacterium canettii CIPT 140060008]CCK54112.1 Putative fatty-acid-